MSASHIEAVCELRLRLLARGYEPVPIIAADATDRDGNPVKSRGKRPRLDNWRGINLTPEEVRGWRQSLPRDTNTGVRCGRIIGADIDILDANLASEIEQLAMDLLGSTQLRRVGKAPKVLLTYAAEGDITKIETDEYRLPDGTKAQVEILAAGQQFVSHGTHPDTHGPYVWTDQTPENVQIEELPHVNASELRGFIAAAAAAIEQAGGVSIKALDQQRRGQERQHRAPPSAAPAGNGGGFFREVNARALANCDAWVRQLFPRAYWQPNSATPPGAWRVASADLGRGLEEDISIHPIEGCQDFGTRQSLSPIDLIMEWAGAPDAIAAALTLCEWLRIDPAAMGWNDRKAKPSPPDADAPSGAPKATGRFKLVWFQDIVPRLDAADFVQGLLQEGSACLLYGESNSGKTFFATDLALHVAAGKEWMGRRVDQGGVIYVVLEGGFGFRNRVEAWRREHGMEGVKLPFAAIESPVNLLDPDADTPALIQAIEEAAALIEMPIKLVIIDTLSRAMAGGDENSSEDMGALVINMDRIRHKTAAACGFIHHSGKDAARGARGHSLLRAAVDTEIEVTADEAAQTRSARVVKQRDLPKGAEFPFALTVVELGTNRHGEPVTSCTVHAAEAASGTAKRSLSGDQQLALRLLHDLLAEKGEPGYPGVPNGVNSVPEGWWRERFYDRAKPGADQDTKQKAFRRAADALVNMNAAAINRGRVWTV